MIPSPNPPTPNGPSIRPGPASRRPPSRRPRQAAARARRPAPGAEHRAPIRWSPPPPRCWPPPCGSAATAVTAPDVDQLRARHGRGDARFRDARRWRPGWTPARCAPPATRCARPSTISCSARPGARRVLGAAEHDQHLPQRGHRRRAVLRDPGTDAARSRPPRTGGRADVSLRCRSVSRAATAWCRAASPALTELRDGVYRTIRQRRGDFERELSPHWRGLPRRTPLSQRVPLWAVGLGTAVDRGGYLSSASTCPSPASPTSRSRSCSTLPPRGAGACRTRRCRAPAPCRSRRRSRRRPSPRLAPSCSTFLAPEIKAGTGEVLRRRRRRVTRAPDQPQHVRLRRRRAGHGLPPCSSTHRRGAE